MVVDLEDGKARIVGKVDAGYIFVDGTTIGDISVLSLTDRRILGEEGFISVVAVVNTHASRSSAARTSMPAGSSRTMACSTRYVHLSFRRWRQRYRKAWTTPIGFSR